MSEDQARTTAMNGGVERSRWQLRDAPAGVAHRTLIDAADELVETLAQLLSSAA